MAVTVQRAAVPAVDFRPVSGVKTMEPKAVGIAGVSNTPGETGRQRVVERIHGETARDLTVRLQDGSRMVGPDMIGSVRQEAPGMTGRVGTLTTGRRRVEIEMIGRGRASSEMTDHVAILAIGRRRVGIGMIGLGRALSGMTGHVGTLAIGRRRVGIGMIGLGRALSGMTGHAATLATGQHHEAAADRWTSRKTNHRETVATDRVGSEASRGFEEIEIDSGQIARPRPHRAVS